MAPKARAPRPIRASPALPGPATQPAFVEPDRARPQARVFRAAVPFSLVKTPPDQGVIRRERAQGLGKAPAGEAGRVRLAVCTLGSAERFCQTTRRRFGAIHWLCSRINRCSPSTMNN